MLFLSFLFLFIPAQAALFPTKPISNTTYIAGQAALVTWIEDGTAPLLASLGQMKIDLYAGHNTFLATLAKDINPLALSTTIFIPSAMPVHYYHFNLRFKAASPATTSSVVTSRPLPRPRLHVPSTTIYTANFSITPNPLSAQSMFPVRTSTSTHTSTFSENTSSPLTLIIPTPASRLVPSPTATKGKSGAVGRGLGDMRYAKTFDELSVRIHSAEMQFQLAFVIWPALIAISLTM